MNRDDMREMVSQLEALEALATLFNNLWFDHIKRDIRDQKVQAYLMVFEDAFPHLNHVVEFVRRSAGVLSAGKASQDNWAHLQREFETLRRLLAGAEAEDAPPAAEGRAVEADLTDAEQIGRAHV